LADEQKLPAEIAARALAPAEQSGSLVARGLAAIKGRQRTISVEAETSFRRGMGAEECGHLGEAWEWYRKAADQGHAAAQFKLGFICHVEAGMYGDPTYDSEAIPWFRLAAEQGYAEAQLTLGIMYAHGQGIPQDYVQAHMWFDRCVRSASNTEEHDQAVERRDAIAARMTPAQIAEAQRLVREWAESHAS